MWPKARCPTRVRANRQARGGQSLLAARGAGSHRHSGCLRKAQNTKANWTLNNCSSVSYVSDQKIPPTRGASFSMSTPIAETALVNVLLRRQFLSAVELEMLVDEA